MRRLLLAEKWDGLARRILPPGCSLVQKQEMRRVFYAGAESMMRCILGEISPGKEVSPEDEAVMENLDVELREFAKAMLEGRA